MSLSRLRKAPSRLLERVTHWRRSRSGRGPNGGDVSDNSSSTGGGGTHLENGEEDASIQDEPLLTEQDHKELMSLLNQNISMDFILEMKEAFQLFDKVGQTNEEKICRLSGLTLRVKITFGGQFFRVFLFETSYKKLGV